MSDFDFLKEFGKNMGRDRLHEQSAHEWARAAASLDARDAADLRRRRLVGWVFPIAVAASFLWLATAFWHSERRTDGLRTEVLTLKSSLENFKKTSDTVVRRVEIVRFDTVYRTVVVRRVVEEVSAKAGLSEKAAGSGMAVFFENKKGADNGADAEILAKNPDAHPSRNQPAASPENPSGIPQKNESAAVFVEKEPKTDESGAVSTIFSKNETAAQTDPAIGFSMKKLALMTAPLPAKPVKQLVVFSKKALPETGLAMLPAPPVGQKARVVRRLRSPDFQLGARVALLYPVTDRAAGNSFSVGVAIEKEVSARFSVFAAVDFGQLYFHVQPDKLAESGLPVPIKPDPSFELKKASVGQPILDLSTGIRYGFWLKKGMRPYFLAAWVFEQANRQELRYEYFDPITEGRPQVRLPGQSRDFNARGAQFGLGADWAVRRWTIGASGFYQRQFASRDAFLAKRFGLRAGARYSF